MGIQSERARYASAQCALHDEGEHLATVAALIECGLGVSVVPELTLFQFRLPNLVAIPLDAPELMRPLLIVTQKERSLSLAAQGLLALVEAKAQAEAGHVGRRKQKPAARRGGK